MAGPFHFASYKRPQSDGLQRDHAAVSDTGEMPTESLSDLLGRVLEDSTAQIDNLVGDFERLQEKLRTDGERIQHEIEEYNLLSQQIMELTQTISGSLEKVRASVDN